MEKISVHDLPFKQVPAQKEAELKYSKGIFGGVKKKFAQSLLAGKVWVSEVQVVDWRMWDSFRSQNSYFDYPFCKIATEDGTICKEWCIVAYEAYFFGAAEWTEEDPFDEAEVEALNNKKRHGYVLKYYLGKEERYILIDRKGYKDLNLVMDSIEPYFGYYADYTACLQEHD